MLMNKKKERIAALPAISEVEQTLRDRLAATIRTGNQLAIEERRLRAALLGLSNGGRVNGHAQIPENVRQAVLDDYRRGEHQADRLARRHLVSPQFVRNLLHECGLRVRQTRS